jgi:hypothetical protein
MVCGDIPGTPDHAPAGAEVVGLSPPSARSSTVERLPVSEWVGGSSPSRHAATNIQRPDVRPLVNTGAGRGAPTEGPMEHLIQQLMLRAAAAQAIRTRSGVDQDEAFKAQLRERRRRMMMNHDAPPPVPKGRLSSGGARG